MYIPHHFENKNLNEIRDFISQNSFAILVSQSQASPVATHIPLLLDQDENGKDILSGHVARMNPHTRLLKPDSQVLAIFLGPHTYISSSWYSHENVPTWNYLAVHIYGTLRLIEGDRLYRQLKMLVDKYEKSSDKPINLESMSPTYIKKQMNGIVGFEIQIAQIQGAYKLSQNRTPEDFENIIRELEKRGDPQSNAVAKEMKKKRTDT